MRSSNLAVLLADMAARQGWADRTAFLAGDQVWSHADVHDGAARVASVLAEAGVGVGRGDRVLIALPDSVEFVWAFLASARLGAIAVLVNPLLGPEEHHYMIKDCQPSTAVCTEALAGRFHDACAVVTDQTLAARAAQSADRPVAAVDGSTAAYAQYTSGTTGRPKAALHRHTDPGVYFEAMGRGVLELQPDDVLLSVSKAYFAYGLGNSVVFPLYAGASAVLHAGRPTVAAVVSLVARHQPTVLFGVPSFYANLVAGAEAGRGHHDIGSVRAAVCAGETLLPSLYDRLTHYLGCPVYDGLGSTEVGQTFISNGSQALKAGTLGRALPPYQIDVRDESGRPVAAGSTGELWVRGPSVMLGYLGKPEETARVLDDGWLATRDRVTVDEDGYVRHFGRVDDLEMVGGITVSPQEVEALLAAHPAVAEAAVAAVRHRSGASLLHAYAVLLPGRQASDALADELRELVRSRMAPFKVPRVVHFVAELPRTPTGKLRRFQLRSGTWPRLAEPDEQEGGRHAQ